jgi:TolA-binding protein
MKTNLINTMAIVVLVISIPAFALAGDTKREAPATAQCNTAQQDDSDQEASDPEESSVSKKLDQLQKNVLLRLDQLQKEVQHLEATDKERQEEEQRVNQERMKRVRQQNEEWEHSLLGIYGG